MSHLMGEAIKISVADSGKAFRYRLDKDKSGIYCRRRFALTSLAQAKREVGNASATLHRPPIGDAEPAIPYSQRLFLLSSMNRYGGMAGHAGSRRDFAKMPVPARSTGK